MVRVVTVPYQLVLDAMSKSVHACQDHLPRQLPLPIPVQHIIVLAAAGYDAHTGECFQHHFREFVDSLLRQVTVVILLDV